MCPATTAAERRHRPEPSEDAAVLRGPAEGPTGRVHGLGETSSTAGRRPHNRKRIGAEIWRWPARRRRSRAPLRTPSDPSPSLHVPDGDARQPEVPVGSPTALRMFAAEPDRRRLPFIGRARHVRGRQPRRVRLRGRPRGGAGLVAGAGPSERRGGGIGGRAAEVGRGRADEAAGVRHIRIRTDAIFRRTSAPSGRSRGPLGPLSSRWSVCGRTRIVRGFGALRGLEGPSTASKRRLPAPESLKSLDSRARQ